MTATARPQWRNRIVAHGEMPANQFLAHESNARRHPAAQRDALRSSLNELGWVGPVIVSKRSGKLLDGHARIEEALTRDENAAVPFVEVDVTEAEEKQILAVFDPITGLADYDRAALDALLREVETGDAGLSEMLAGLARQNQLYETGGNDLGEHWRGMPEFNQPADKPYQSISFHFQSRSDVDEFARLIGYTITEKTHYLWFPYRERENLKKFQVADES